MIPFEHIPDLMRKMKTPNYTVVDSANKILYRHEGTDIENAISDLLEMEHFFSNYRVITVKGATASQAKGNWKDFFPWTVHFNTQQSPNNLKGQQVQVSGNLPKGYISEDHAKALAQLEAFKMMAELKKQLDEMKMTIALEDKKDPMKYMGLAPLLFDIDDKKLMQMAKFQSLSSGRGMAGMQTQTETEPAQEKTTNLKQNGAAEEKKDSHKDDEIIAASMQNLHTAYESGKLDLGLLKKITDKLKDDPTLLNTLSTLL